MIASDLIESVDIDDSESVDNGLTDAHELRTSEMSDLCTAY